MLDKSSETKRETKKDWRHRPRAPDTPPARRFGRAPEREARRVVRAAKERRAARKRERARRRRPRGAKPIKRDSYRVNDILRGAWTRARARARPFKKTTASHAHD